MMEAMTEWLDYPQSEIESDERRAAKVGVDGLWDEIVRQAGAAKPDHHLLVDIVVLALRTNTTGAQEVVKAALRLLERDGWYEMYSEPDDGDRRIPLDGAEYRARADRLAAAIARSRDQMRISAAFDAAEAAGNDARKRWKDERANYMNRMGKGYQDFWRQYQDEGMARLTRGPRVAQQRRRKRRRA